MENKKILVIDDDLDNVTYVETVLRKAGFKTIYAMDGSEGLTRARADAPDLIVLDIQMPNQNGFEVYKCLQSEEATKKIPVVMLTGIRDKIGRGYSQKDMKAIYGQGPSAYLEKPVTPEDLLKAVRASL